MQVFEESNLIFTFSPAWTVRKYDEHPFYLAMSGAGISAVDFVGIHESGKVFLMEVKNYRDRPRKEWQRTVDKLEGSQPLLAEIFKNKVEETRIGINAIATYLNRKWHYRLMFQLLDRSVFRKHLLKYDRLFWMKINQKLTENPAQIEVILWMELPSDLEEKRVNLKNYFHHHQQGYWKPTKVYSTSDKTDLAQVEIVEDIKKRQANKK